MLALLAISALVIPLAATHSLVLTGSSSQYGYTRNVLQPQYALTVQCWIKTTNPGGSEEVIVTDTNTGVSTGTFWLSVAAGGNMHYVTFTGGGSSTDVYGTVTVTDGNWHQVMAAWNISGLQVIYVDGALDNVGFNGNSVNSQISSPIYIGAANEGTGFFYTGKIMWLAIYRDNYANSDLELQFYNGGLPNPFLNMLSNYGSASGFWPLNGQSTDIANGNNFAFVNSPTYSTDVP